MIKTVMLLLAIWVMFTVVLLIINVTQKICIGVEKNMHRNSSFVCVGQSYCVQREKKMLLMIWFDLYAHMASIGSCLYLLHHVLPLFESQFASSLMIFYLLMSWGIRDGEIGCGFGCRVWDREAGSLMQGRQVCLNLWSILHHSISVTELGSMVLWLLPAHTWIIHLF